LSEIVKGVDAAESAVWIRLISRSPPRSPLFVEVEMLSGATRTAARFREFRNVE